MEPRGRDADNQMVVGPSATGTFGSAVQNTWNAWVSAASSVSAAHNATAAAISGDTSDLERAREYAHESLNTLTTAFR